MDLTQTDELKPKVKATLMKLMDDFGRWRSLIDSMHHAELASLVLDESGYMQMWKTDKSIEAPGRVENLKELISGMQEYESMAEFLEHVSLVLGKPEQHDGRICFADDAAQREGAGVRRGVPAGVGRRFVPLAADDG
jgi:superfamily I DNA/RNA helicase